MPRLNLRHVAPPPDPDEGLLVSMARALGYAARFNSLAERAGRPHIELFVVGHPELPPYGPFATAMKAVEWLEDAPYEARHASAR